jgi:hypothetical protein
MDDLKQQVDRLEWRIDLHEEQLATLQKNAVVFKDQLDAINQSLMQIKWFVVGGVICWLSEQLGLLGILKLIGV